MEKRGFFLREEEGGYKGEPDMGSRCHEARFVVLSARMPRTGLADKKIDHQEKIQ